MNLSILLYMFYFECFGSVRVTARDQHTSSSEQEGPKTPDPKVTLGSLFIVKYFHFLFLLYNNNFQRLV